ncbi:MAG: hypothetical protein M1813_001314 [Trichoglossum hirsutum]|nr:MAG: hypothetical protein M1813_001314 [Trichoglossum hirsutum]
MTLEIANGQRIAVKGKGHIEVPGSNGLILADVWHAPDMTSNLVSLGQLEDKGITMIKEGKSIFLTQNNTRIASVYRIERLYSLRRYLKDLKRPVVLWTVEYSRLEAGSNSRAL